jgi:hypothetical protein
MPSQISREHDRDTGEPSLRAEGDAIQFPEGFLDRFVASLLAMTIPLEWITP